MIDGTPAPQIAENRPGLSKLDYRITDYKATRQRLLQLLPHILRSSDGQFPAPLARLTSRLTDDPTIALLDAWAVVADVLTFYQERIANEGYLRTATERRSVLELARMIGYELDPGVAASTYMAFTVEEAPGSPDVVTIPIGTQIMSVPVKDELPQIFETIEEFVARREWNTLKPRQTRPQTISGNTHQLYLQGNSPPLRAGDKLLLIDDIPDLQKYLLTLTEVQSFPDAGYTLIQWEQSFPMLVEPLRNPKLFTFQQRALLFGNTAPQWEMMPAEVKLAALAAKGQPIQGGVFRSPNNGQGWEAASQGLPNEDILSLTIREGVLFAGTSTKGVFRSRDNGKTWSAANQGLTNLRIQALYVNAQDGQSPVFAGTPGGGLFRSKDLGENWVPINFGSVRVESVSETDPPTDWRSINTSLPNTVVRSILMYENVLPTEILNSLEDPDVPAANRLVVAGTDDGVFLSPDLGKNWYPRNLSNLAIYSLLITPTADVGTGQVESIGFVGEGTLFETELQPNDRILALGQSRTVIDIISNTALQLNDAFTGDAAGISFEIERQEQGNINAVASQTTLAGIDTRFTEWMLGTKLQIDRTIVTVAEIHSDVEITIAPSFPEALGTGRSFEMILVEGTGNLSVPGDRLTTNSAAFSTAPGDDDLLIIGEQTRTIREVSAIGSNVVFSVDPAFTESLGSSVGFRIVRSAAGIVTNAVVVGEGTTFTSLESGDILVIGTVNRTVTGIISDRIVTIASPLGLDVTGDSVAFQRRRPGTGTLAISDRILTIKNTSFSQDIQPGDVISLDGEVRTVEEGSEVFVKLEQAFKAPFLIDRNFTIGGGHHLFAGTDAGVHRSGNWGEGIWTDTNTVSGQGEVLANQTIYALISTLTHLFALNPEVGDFLFAATDTGVYRSSNQGDSWQAIATLDNAAEAGVNSLEDCQIRSLALYDYQGTTYLVAASDRGIFVSENSTEENPTWKWVSQDLATQNTTTVIFNGATDDREKAIYAGSQFAGFVAEETQTTAESATPEPQRRKIEWPDFRIPSSTEIDLDTLYPQLLNQSWIVLFDDRNPDDPEERTEPRIAIRQVRDISTVFRSEFGLTSKVTRIEPDQEVEPEAFGLRSTIVLIQNELLELAREPVTVSDRQYEIFQDPILAGRVFLDQFVQGFQPNQSVIVSGKPIRAQLDNVGGVLLPRQWERWVAGLDNQEVQTLLENNGTFYAGTADGVYRFQPDRHAWEPINIGLDNRNVRTLVIHDGNLLAGTAKGIYQLQVDRLTWTVLYPDVEVRVLASQNDVLLAGTSTGVYYLEGGNEEPRDGLTNTTVNALLSYTVSSESEPGNETVEANRISSKDVAVFGEAEVLIRLKIGEIITAAEQSRIIIGKKDNELIINQPFKPDLVAVPFQIGGTYTFAATEDGVYRSINHNQQWQKLNQGTTQPIPEGVAYSLLAFTQSVSGSSEHSILVGTAQGIYRSINHGQDWESIGDNLLTDTAIRSLICFEDQSKERWIFAGTLDGRVFRSNLQLQLQHWQSIEIGLKATEIRSLQLAQNQTLWAGTEAGIFRSPQLGSELHPIEWQRSNQGLSNSQILVLANDAQGKLWAGTTAGIFQSNNQGRYWQPLLSWERVSARLKTKAIQALLIKPAINNAVPEALERRTATQIFQPELIVVGTAEGIYLSSDRGDRWTEISREQGLIYADVRSLALYPIDGSNSHLLAGTIDGGIFRSSDQGKTWTPTGLNNTDVQAIAVHPPILFAGTVRDGLFRSTNDGLIWEQFTATRPGTGSLSSDGAVLSGSNTRFSTELQIGDVINVDDQARTVVAIESDRRLTVNVPFRPELSYAQFTMNTGLTNRNITALATGARLQQGNLTSNPNATNPVQQRQIRGDEMKFTAWFKPGDTITIHGEESSQTRTVTEVTTNLLTLDRPLSQRLSGDTKFTINLNLIFAGTDGSGVFRSRDNGDRWQAVNTKLEDLEIRCLSFDPQTGEIWAGTARGGVFRSSNEGDLWQAVNTHLTNLDMRSILISDSNDPDQPSLLIGGVGILQSPDRLYSRLIQRGEVVDIVTPPELVSDRSEEHQRWQVRNKDGFVGIVTAIDQADLSFLPASEGSEPRSELAAIQEAPTDQQLPILTLKEPLKYSYDPATVNIYANVAQATHGETVEEVLGSGNGNEANQRFTLKKPPLTYIPAANAQGAASTLQVRVNGVLWQEVDSLYPLTPQDQSYIVRIENDGTTTAQFGDGSKGARLPSGIENIIARYRSGIGPAGNMGAGRLSLLKTRPQGISEVVNPLPATGGAPPESLETARTKAPPTVRTLDRIVSLQDFEDFVQGFAGIGKAQAVALWSGDSQLVHITIAAVAGDAVDPTSNLYTKLIAAIDNTRDPIQQVQVDSYEQLLFNLEARLLIDPRYEAEEVKTKVREALAQTFAFEKRAFGQAVTAAETIAAMQAIPGMIAVDLDALYQLGRSKALEQSLTALPARNLPQSNTIRPAQLLLLNQAGIQLTIVTAL
ncbi:MAG: hypothetical protein Kow00121_05470 [Elainellaceae cyanobacterium]